MNLTTDLSYYNAFIPCGIDPKLGGVCNLQFHVSKLIMIDAFLESWIKSLHKSLVLKWKRSISHKKRFVYY